MSGGPPFHRSACWRNLRSCERAVSSYNFDDQLPLCYLQLGIARQRSDVWLEAFRVRHRKVRFRDIECHFRIEKRNYSVDIYGNFFLGKEIPEGAYIRCRVGRRVTEECA